MDIDYSEYDGTDIRIKYMINESHELIILSTNDADHDKYIKNALNYKHVSDSDLKAYKVYILPVKFAVNA